jgi:hypothetical protein
VWNAAILKGQGRGKKLASWRGTRYCDVVTSLRKLEQGSLPGIFQGADQTLP